MESRITRNGVGRIIKRIVHSTIMSHVTLQLYESNDPSLMKINFLSKYLKHLVLHSKMQKTKNGQFFQAKVLAYYLLFLNII